MTRRIPIFEYNEELKSKKLQVYKSLIDGVSEAIKTNKEEIKICEVKNTNTYINKLKTNPPPKKGEKGINQASLRNDAIRRDWLMQKLISKFLEVIIGVRFKELIN